MKLIELDQIEVLKERGEEKESLCLTNSVSGKGISLMGEDMDWDIIDAAQTTDKANMNHSYPIHPLLEDAGYKAKRCLIESIEGGIFASMQYERKDGTEFSASGAIYLVIAAAIILKCPIFCEKEHFDKTASKFYILGDNEEFVPDARDIPGLSDSDLDTAIESSDRQSNYELMSLLLKEKESRKK